MSQRDVLRKYLKSGRRISQLEAVLKFGILRLSERVRELEAEGCKIARQWAGKSGKRFMTYRIS